MAKIKNYRELSNAELAWDFTASDDFVNDCYAHQDFSSPFKIGLSCRDKAWAEIERRGLVDTYKSYLV